MVESFKSGFEPPGDVEFEDYGQAMKRTVSNTSLTSSREAKDKPVGKSKVKLWPFKNKNKVTHERTQQGRTHLPASETLLICAGREGRDGRKDCVRFLFRDNIRVQCHICGVVYFCCYHLPPVSPPGPSLPRQPPSLKRNFRNTTNAPCGPPRAPEPQILTSPEK